MPRLYKDSYYFDEPLVFAVEFYNFILIWFLVSTAVQRLHLSEFELYFKVASAFMSPDTFSSTEPRQAKYKRRKLQKDNKTDKTFTFKTLKTTQFPLLHRPLAPPCRLVNSPQHSSSSPWSWRRMSADHQAVCLMLLPPTCGHGREGAPTTRLSA